MNYLGFAIGFPVFILLPGLVASWLGARVRWPWLAFVLAWLLTPFAMLLFVLALAPLLRALTPPGNDGTGAIMLPFVGIATGLVAGGVAAFAVARRRGEGGATAGGAVEEPQKKEETLR